MTILATYRCIECYTQYQIDLQAVGSSSIAFDYDSEESATTHLQENLDHCMVSQYSWEGEVS